ncbi:drug resistance transporter, EmrB/QacA subfamily [Streptomyces sp. 2224.1]|nr:drug resistance transporter, EmrB/QacA subfamily [Streptomyces sp. 2112.3]SEE23721.1 drug resistance transporter, EmrB/QacA subfamily [Streptomyces sp. 2224.1]
MRPWWPLVAICLGTFLFLLDTTVLNVALPAIGTDLQAPLSGLQWVVNIYTLALAVLMLPFGSLADRFGARNVYVAGLTVFALASLGCALAPGTGLLIASRAVQGIGGAAMSVSAFALIGVVYRGPDRGTAMGVFGAVTGLGAAVGPMLGGVLTEYLSWRAAFLLNLPLVAGTVVLTLRVLGNDRRPRAHRVDLPGTVAFAVCAGALVHGLTRAGEDGWTPAGYASIALAAVALAVFVVLERRCAHPMLDVRLFGRASFAAVMLCVLASSAAFAALLFTSVWLQSDLGLGPVRAGLALMPLALTSFATSLVAGRTLRGTSPRLVVGTGLLLSGVGCALQSGLDATSTASSVALGLAVTGIGIGVMGPALSGAVFAAVPADRGGMAAGAMTTFRQLGPTLAVAVFGVLFRTGSGTAPAEGLDRVYVAAAAAGLIGAALAYTFVRAPARVAAAPVRRDVSTTR